MIKSITKRSVAFLLALSLVFSVFPVISFAYDLGGLNVSGLTATYTEGTWNAQNGNQITGSVTGTSTAGCENTSSGTLTLKNSKTEAAVLSFDYVPTVNEGSVKINGTEVTSNGHFEQEINSNASIQVVLTSAKGVKTTKISITNIQLVVNKTVSVTFSPSSGGTITVNGETITTEKTFSQQSTVGFQVSAAPSSGNKFFRWENENGDNVSSKASDTLYPDNDQTIHAVFLSSTSPVFSVSGTNFIDFGEAIEYAVQYNKSQIILIESGTISGNYTIPSGKTLLIPFDSAYTIYTTTPDVLYGSHTTPSVFRTLTMASGSSITVASGGKIAVPSKLSATGTGTGSWNGTPTGPYGKIQMQQNSNITVQSGGGLYVYGYIAGSGNVLIQSGGEVYEAMQFRCWRGGSATTGMISGSVFPMSQYYVQNVEVPMTIEAGATETVYTSTNMSSAAYPASAVFIGSSGMFNITSGSVTKRYDGTTDRLIIDVDGNLTIRSMALTVAGQSIKINVRRVFPGSAALLGMGARKIPVADQCACVSAIVVIVVISRRSEEAA